MNEKETNVFQSTLNLPQTTFPLRANASQREPEILAQWERDQLAQKATERNKGNKKFILHDGPPYANGHLHMGHAFNNILKDITCKSKRMTGYHVPLIPGWDCHGLPIELKVTTQLGVDAKTGDRVAFKKACRAYASQWIETQKNELKDLGKLADYDNAYITMDPAYEASILRSLATFVEKGYIQRKGKTVPWCASCQTVLAAAEIEYNDRKDPSCFIAFTLSDHDARMTFPFCFEKDQQLVSSCVVWTTTPWTIPLNRAVVLNPSATYVVLQGVIEHQAYIVAKDLAESFCTKVNIPMVILAECDASALLNKRAVHPLSDSFTVPVLCDQAVVVSEGTACLHCAPGCGPEDYLLGKKNGLEIYSPVASDGRYTIDIEPKELVGMPVAEGQFWVLKKLAERGKLVYKMSIIHSYPHCWRCHQGLIFRATDQWFCDVQKNDLVAGALKEIEQMTFIPEYGKARLNAFVGNRSEWCISRQRQWGVPIVAMQCRSCGHAIIDATMIRNVADKVAIEGVEYWDRITASDLVRDGLVEVLVCPHCNATAQENFMLERDILDVWFDSGVSNAAILKDSARALAFPADVYLEGSDQHRGWFQSSLLCSMVLNGQAPTKTILTHGFIVDEVKHKMSKSVGNVVAPHEVIQKYSRDILRLWVASSDFEGDVVISEKLLGNVAEVYRKIRNTCRFMLSNFYDFEYEKNAVMLEQLEPLDSYALARLHEVYHDVIKAYEAYKFAQVVSIINNYCANDLSAVYLDIVKDRLYVEGKGSRARRSAQTTLFHILDTLTHLLAPMLSFTAEDIASHYQKENQGSIHLQDFTTPVDIWKGDVHQQVTWRVLEQLREAVLKAIEPQRAAGAIKHSLEANVTIFLQPESEQAALINDFISDQLTKETMEQFFIDWCIVSDVTFATSGDDLAVTDLDWLKVLVQRVQGEKCPRCWHWSVTDHAQKLCSRCQGIVSK
ncbi:MAG: isoleucine--tRNA ligase [Candidatus Babeliales bacterium]